MPIPSQRVDVLGVGISALNLDSAKQIILDRLKRREKGYICVTGVHGVMEAQDDPGFRRILNESFLTTPDGMPMVWISWLNGRKEVDRVYGPDLMLEMAEATQDGAYTHFLYGGRPGIAELLQKRLEARYPGIRIVGTYTPPFGPLSGDEEKKLRERFHKLKPDMTWIGLSTPKQERFMADYLAKLDTTVMCGVGAAFDFHSKVVKQAPRWIQRSGFEWLYRTFQEPKRLLPRYLRNNTRFLWRYGLGQLGLPCPEGHQGKDGKKRLAFLGIRGIPGLYSGFETFVEELGPRLVREGWDVTVYCRSHLYPERPKEFQGMKLVYLPAIRTKSLETITHTLLSCFHSVLHRFDLVYLCGVGNALTSAILRLGGSRVVINVDGDDFRRPKWHWFARWWLRKSESWATRLADRVIADNTAILRRYQQSYGFTPNLIGYGSPLAERPKSTEILQRLGVKDREYILCVGRISPENRVDLLVKAHKKSGVKMPLVIVGSHGYETRYYEECQRAAAPNVIFAGPVYGDGYRELSLHAKIFVLPAAIEATRVVLVDQLGFGAAIVFQDCPASREVLGEAGEPFAPEQPEESLAQTLRKLDADEGRLQQLRAGALARAQACYNWEKVTKQYEALFREVSPAAKKG